MKKWNEREKKLDKTFRKYIIILQFIILPRMTQNELCPFSKNEFWSIPNPLVAVSVRFHLWVTFVFPLVIWNSSWVPAPAEVSKALTNGQVVDEGSLILESRGGLNKLIKKYGCERAVFKGNRFELNELLSIRKHSWGHKHTEAPWQSLGDYYITCLCYLSLCPFLCVSESSSETQKESVCGYISSFAHPIVSPWMVEVDGWLL